MWWGLLLDGAGGIPLLLFGRKMRVAWVAHFFVMVMWGVFAIKTRQPGFLPGAVIYAGVDVWGWLKWGAKDHHR